MIPKSTMVKANMATEHQTYAVKSGGGYVIGVRTDTPDVPFGSSFQTLVQFKLLPAENKKQTTLVSPLLRSRHVRHVCSALHPELLLSLISRPLSFW
jgi:hypothetical protein